MAETTPPPLDPALYESMAGVVIAVVTVCLTVAVTTVCLRTYTRAAVLRQFGADDWAAILSIIFAIGSGTMVALNTKYGHGRHLAVVDPTLLWKYFRTFYISIVLYNASLTATKLTFLLQYHRILGNTAGMRKVIVIAFVLVGLWSISQLLVVIFTCTPIHKFWLPETPGTCIPNLPFWYINAAGNIVTDVIVFCIPLPSVTRLKLRRGAKLALIGVFCLGFFTCAISVIRIQYLRLSDDVTWDNVASSCWSIGELCSGITCACLPTLRPLVSRMMPGMGSHSGGSATGPRKYYYGSSRSGNHDGSLGASRHKGTRNDETASARGIIYPEDVELHSDNGSDKDRDFRGDIRAAAPSPSSLERATRPPTLDRARFGLGPKSTVHTEVGVATPGPESAWRAAEGRIQVKTDFIITRGK
ncbi:hypothetical protein VTJ83DRAFT_705 [Remersonia thermophila]|uniref:Rhodopsin domain-containing protein n=1 Tax=Remersonia thermophila TaxID=72144 RepID=A0ABR4DP67_9PEZI